MSGLLIAIPTFDTLRAEFVRSLIALTEQLQTYRALAHQDAKDALALLKES